MQGGPITRILPSDLAKTKVISGRRITIPQEVADDLGAKVGDEFFLFKVREGVWFLTRHFEPGQLEGLQRLGRH